MNTSDSFLASNKQSKAVSPANARNNNSNNIHGG